MMKKQPPLVWNSGVPKVGVHTLLHQLINASAVARQDIISERHPGVRFSVNNSRSTAVIWSNDEARPTHFPGSNVEADTQMSVLKTIRIETQYAGVIAIRLN